MLPMQMFPCLLACATFVVDTNFVSSGTQKMFLILFRNILCPQQMFPSLRSSRNIEQATVCLSSFTRALISAKICRKDAFYTLLVVLYRRFSDLYGRAGDSVCIRETPGSSRRVGIDAYIQCTVGGLSVMLLSIQ